MAVGKYSRHALRYARLPLFLEGTLGVDKGPGSDGVLIGAITPGALTKAFAYDHSETSKYTDETTAAGNSSSNDMHLFPAVPAENDAYYFGGGSAPFYGLDLTLGTAANSPVMTVVWEYYNGSAWTTLTPTLDESETLLVGTTGTKKVRWQPPSDWASTTVNSVAGYYVRARCSAFSSIGVVPLGTRAWALPLTGTVGIRMPYTGTIKAVDWYASTKSGSAGDSKFLVVNLTRGTCGLLTLTKGLVAGAATDLALGFSEDDLLALVQIGEDGGTEYADVQLIVQLEP